MDTSLFASSAVDTGAHAIKDRDGWLAARRQMVTASVSPAILGVGYGDALEAYVEYVTPPVARTLTPDDAMFWGSALEQPILQILSAYYGWQYQPGGELLRSLKHPHLGATLDGVIDRGLGWENYEGKTTGLMRAEGWSDDVEMPDEVLVQAQHQMIVTGSERATVTCVIGGQKAKVRFIEPHAELQAVIVEQTEEFLQHVKSLSPPPPTAKSRDALRALHPKDDGSYVRLPPEAIEWTEEIKSIAAKMKLLKDREESLRNHIRACIGSATYGVLDDEVMGKRVWQWKHQTRAGYTVEPSESRTLLNVKGPKIRDELFEKLPVASVPGALELATAAAEH